MTKMLSCPLRALTAAIFFSLGLGAATPVGATDTGHTQVHTVHMAGAERRAVVHVPDSVVPGARGAPVVLALHGLGSAGRVLERRSDLIALADAEGFIAVFPDGHARPEAGRGLYWNAPPFAREAETIPVMGDRAFLRHLVRDLERRGLADPTRVFALGYSLGGMMAAHLACEDSFLVLGIAVVSGALTTEECRPQMDVSLLQIHGLADSRVPFAGGAGAAADLTWPDAETGVRNWADRLGCGSLQAVRATTDTGNGAVCLAARCPAGRVKMCVDPELGHAWPGAPDTFRRAGGAGAAPREDALSASAEAWAFFESLTPRTVLAP